MRSCHLEDVLNVVRVEIMFHNLDFVRLGTKVEILHFYLFLLYRLISSLDSNSLRYKGNKNKNKRIRECLGEKEYRISLELQ